ncbi:unnamed protein product [Peronospora destructor]|uniref:Uncharacterized protein n=1 Tax=Peronospora destructor TaxID=86335 RepID=A0AAV0TZY7_9STRA|nr:unnamed protein product [Peronospora destructor]
MLVNQQPPPLDVAATATSFQVLQITEVTFKAKNVTADPSTVTLLSSPCRYKTPGSGQDVDRVCVLRREALHENKESTESIACPCGSQSMLNDKSASMLNTLPDCLVLADTQVAGVSKLTDHATNLDHVIKKAVDSLSLKMAVAGHEIAELA